MKVLKGLIMKNKPVKVKQKPANEALWSVEERVRRARQDGIEILAVQQNDGSYVTVGCVDIVQPVKLEAPTRIEQISHVKE